MAKPVVLLYEQIHKDALAILEEKAEIGWAESLHVEDIIAVLEGREPRCRVN